MCESESDVPVLGILIFFLVSNTIGTGVGVGIIWYRLKIVYWTKKSKWIELTLTSSVSRAHRILLCYFMWITSFPGTQCCVSLTNAFFMVQMIMHPQAIFIRESLYTSNHSTEPLRRRRCSRRSRRTFCFRKFFFVPLHVNWKQLSLTFSGEGTVLWPLLLYRWRKYLVPKKGIAGIENIWYRNKLGRYLDI